MKEAVNIFWFRRDLRLHDNAGLYHALKEGQPVIPIFIFDTEILDKLEDEADRRVAFIHSALSEVQKQLLPLRTGIHVFYGFPQNVFIDLIEKYSVQKVYTNHDYELYARQRDERVKEICATNNISFHTYKDQVLFEKKEIVKDNEQPYTVFTPYSKKWKSSLNPHYLASYPAEKYLEHFHKYEPPAIPALETMGFKDTANSFPAKSLQEEIVKNYSDT